MNTKTSRVLYFLGLALLAIGGLVLTLLAYFALIGLPVFIVGIVLILISKVNWKSKILTILASIIAMGIYWITWRQINTVGPEVFIIPATYRGKVNIIYKEDCGVVLKETTEGLKYQIADDGILLVKGKLKTGFIDHTYYLVDKQGKRTLLPKMDVRDFNEEWMIEKNKNEPPRDKLGIFHWGTTGSFGGTLESGLKDGYKYQEFYISTYNDLSNKFDFKYEMAFDSIRNMKLEACR